MDPDTFVIWLYFTVDNFSKQHLPPDRHPGPAGGLSRSEVITLALLSCWSRYPTETAFYAEAKRHLRWAFPHLPDRTQYNRLVRRYTAAITQFALFLADVLVPACSYEVLDSTAARVRDHRRRGRGWFAGIVQRGWSTRLGWYVGFHVLTCCSPQGVITGFGAGSANTDDRDLAETFLAARACREPGLACCGHPHSRGYLADGGFWGPRRQQHWRTCYGAEVVAPPQPGTHYYATWSAAARRWLTAHRQIVETVHDRLLLTFGLDRDRPHTVEGFRARLAARVALHNFCCWLNHQLGRPLLATADLIAW
jgi:hypothetical protein